MKKFLRVFFSIACLLILFRGCIYRTVVAYQALGTRITYPATDPELIQYLDKNAGLSDDASVQAVINCSLDLTADRLRFTAARNNTDPNRLFYTETAHCVGYAAFFTSACNFLFHKYHMDETWTARPQIGQLYCFGVNVHPYFDTPFFKDHDFAIIENKKTGERLAVDPNVYDYLCIRNITLK
jgi:hypothetical protein